MFLKLLFYFRIILEPPRDILNFFPFQSFFFFLIAFILDKQERVVGLLTTCASSQWLLSISFSVRLLYCTDSIAKYKWYPEVVSRRGRGGGGGKKAPLSKLFQTYPTMMKLGTFISYLKKIQKAYESHGTYLEFCWHQHFLTGNQQILLYQKVQI